jgi:hypothetical protein
MSDVWKLETRPKEITNVHRLGPGWSCQPTEKLGLSADHQLLFADENTYRGRRRDFSQEGRYRGQFLGLKASYTFSKHLRGRLWTEFFFPGDYYSDFRNDMVTFLRSELYFTW